MMFKHGFVHCDPHAANLLVRPLPYSGKSILGKKKPQFILLDLVCIRILRPELTTLNCGSNLLCCVIDPAVDHLVIQGSRSGRSELQLVASDSLNLSEKSD
ncbi:unnamed protein product [Prunus armeniaca]|uniref:ABC1 atypical kinase-like domain-containing protein n=1 Tax=Prunus armeniaca TaxID=36596 RepID=A0A6J5XIQ3_PRUAR|nr:unnamed protein product [Prunus armeniaca]